MTYDEACFFVRHVRAEKVGRPFYAEFAILGFKNCEERSGETKGHVQKCFCDFAGLHMDTYISLYL